MYNCREETHEWICANPKPFIGWLSQTESWPWTIWNSEAFLFPTCAIGTKRSWLILFLFIILLLPLLFIRFVLIHFRLSFWLVDPPSFFQGRSIFVEIGTIGYSVVCMGRMQPEDFWGWASPTANLIDKIKFNIAQWAALSKKFTGVQWILWSGNQASLS